MASQYKRSIVLGLDYSEFSGGIAECNRKMGLLEAEFKLAKEQAKNYGTETDQLTIKKEVLSQKIKLQSKIVDENRKAYDKAMTSGNATEKQVDALDKKLLNARTTLEKLNGEYGQACKELDEYSKQQYEAGKKTEESEEKQRSFGDTIRDIADTLGVEVNPMVEAFASKFDGVDEKVGLAVIALGTLATKLIDCSKSAAEYSDNILTLSSVTGLSTDTLQELDYAAELLDVSTDQISSSMSKMVRSMADARDGNKDLQKEFARLGVRYKEHNGELRSAEAVFYDTIDALGKMTNETERDSMAMDLFGRSAKELNPLIEAGSKRFKELGKEAHTVGYVMSTENLQKFGELDDAMRRMDNTSKNLKNNFGLALAPILTDLFEVIAKVPIPVIQGLVGLVGAASGFVLVYKGIKSVTDAGKGVVKMFKGMDIQTLKTTAIIVGVVAALIALATVIAVIIGKGNDLQNAMNSVGNSVSAVTSTVNTAQQVPHYALGTDYSMNGDAWVGEHGPELVRLPRGSRVVPSNVAKNGAGTVNVFYCTIDASNVDDFNKVVQLAQQENQAYRTGRSKI